MEFSGVKISGLEARDISDGLDVGKRVIVMSSRVVALLSVLANASQAAQAPFLTAAYANSPGWVTVAYRHPGSDGVRQFRLEQQGESRVLTSAQLSDTFTVMGLLAGTTYQFRVCATYANSDSCSEWTAVRTMAMQAEPERQSQIAPEVRYVDSTMDTVTIGWGNVGDDKRLLVRVEDERGNSDQRTIRPAVGFKEFTFPGMRSGARYKLMVKGCGTAGCGPWSAGHWVRTSGSPSCIPGFVWREAFPGDSVCVKPDVRDQAAADNAAASTRISTSSCRPGYVPRGAVRNDIVCVAPSARDLAASENALNLSRSDLLRCVRVSIDLTSNNSPCRIPVPCKQGFIPRQATPSDYVCATSDARIRVGQENAASPQNAGGNACIAGYVWRAAAPNDLVCVKPEVRDQAAQDNAQAGGRVTR